MSENPTIPGLAPELYPHLSYEESVAASDARVATLRAAGAGLVTHSDTVLGSRVAICMHPNDGVGLIIGIVDTGNQSDRVVELTSCVTPDARWPEHAVFVFRKIATLPVEVRT